MTTYGYARVSSDGQCLDAQREVLSAAGAAKVFAEKLSGASAANRKELARVLAKLEPCDVLLVTRLDRLARSTRDLLNVLNRVSKAGDWVSQSRRCLGRHHPGTRPADAYHPRRLG